MSKQTDKVRSFLLCVCLFCQQLNLFCVCVELSSFTATKLNSSPNVDSDAV